MRVRIGRRHIRRSVLTLKCLVVAVLAGCSSPPAVQPGSRAADMAGLTHAIAFSSVGAPLDAPDSDGDVLTMVAAVERAVRTSPSVQAALARVRVAEAESKQQRLLPNPVLSLVFRFPEGGGSPTIEAGLAADLVSLLSRPGRIDAADARLRAAAEEVEVVALDVVAEVQERYVAAQAAGELAAAVEERLAIVDRLLGVTQSRLRAGEGTRLDLIALQAQRLELVTELADSRLQLREERLTLARMLGTPSDAASWRLEHWAPAGDEPREGESRWVEAALDARPEVRRQLYEIAALGREVKLTGLTALDGSDAGVDAERDGGAWSVGPAVSTPLPLFDWGQARRSAAEAKVSEAMHELTGLRRRVVEETRRAYAAYVASGENLRRVRTELIPLSRLRLEQAEAQFRGGQTDVTALLQAEEQARASRAKEVELERRWAEALIRLQRAAGGAATTRAVGGPASRPAPAVR